MPIPRASATTPPVESGADSDGIAVQPVDRDRRARGRFTGFFTALALAGLALLLLAPLGVSRSLKRDFSLGLPGVRSGDEPHYLVLINSVISDGDFDLANNYRDMHRGGPQAGRVFAGAPLDHHVNWYEGDRLVGWWQAYQMDPRAWRKDEEGHPVPTHRPETGLGPVPGAEYSQHPPGLAFLLAPILYPFRDTALGEPAALFCSGLATVLGCFAWCWLIRPYARSRAHLLVAAAVTYLGSPLWHYGLVLYGESFLAALAVGAYAAALRGERTGLAGWLLAAGVLIKPPFILIAAPLIADAVLRRKPGQVQQYAVPVAMAVLLVMSWNRFMHGDWLRNAQEWESGSLMEGLYGFTFSWQHGLLLFSPALVLAATALPEWFKSHCRDAILMTSAIVLYGGLMACWWLWGGGTCYSARLILPIVPFLFAPLALVFETRIWQTHRLLRAVGTSLMIVSVVFGAIGAFGCDYVLIHHPLQLLWKIARARAGYDVDFEIHP